MEPSVVSRTGSEVGTRDVQWGDKREIRQRRVRWETSRVTLRHIVSTDAIGISNLMTVPSGRRPTVEINIPVTGHSACLQTQYTPVGRACANA